MPRSPRRPLAVAAFQVGLRRIELDDVQLPAPKPGEVLLQLTAVGICGSDLHYFRIGRIGSQVLEYPQILGHEPAGTIAAVAKGVSGLREGQDVIIEPGISCGRCRACRLGRENLCYHVRFLGSPGFTGAFQQYLVMPASCVRRMPRRIGADVASAVEPLGIGVHAANLVRLKRGESVAIIGAGPIGLSTAAVARRMGARVVAVSDPREVRRRAASRIVSDSGIDPAGFIPRVVARTRGLGATVVFECSGAADAFDTAVLAAERGGRVAIVGITEVDRVVTDPHEWRRRELEIVQVRRSTHTLPAVLSHLAGGDLGLRRAGFFSETVGLNRLQAAFEELEDEASNAIKILVDPRRT
jgi:L-iditol 2-dehydrogenase